jgi:3-phosphoglycerate kinase
MFVACLGGTVDNKVALEDRLLMAYCLIDTVDKLLLGGDLALLFMSYESKPKDSRLQGIVDRVVEYAAEKHVEIVLPSDFLLAAPCELPQDEATMFTWGHFAAEYQLIEAGQEQPQGFSVVGYGPKTAEKWQSVLMRCIRVLWSGSLDLHCSDNPELNGLSRSVVDYLYSKRELKDVKCAVYDVEPSLSHVITVSGYLTKEQEVEPRSPTSSLESSISALDMSQQASQQALTPQELIESMFTHIWSGGPLTLALLQSHKVKGLNLLDENPKPKQKAIEDDTSYLELI